MGRSADPKDYTYLAKGEQAAEPHDVAGFGEIVSALKQQGIPMEIQEEWWACLAAVLILGNVTFDEVPGTKTL